MSRSHNLVTGNAMLYQFIYINMVLGFCSSCLILITHLVEYCCSTGFLNAMLVAFDKCVNLNLTVDRKNCRSQPCWLFVNWKCLKDSLNVSLMYFHWQRQDEQQVQSPSPITAQKLRESSIWGGTYLFPSHLYNVRSQMKLSLTRGIEVLIQALRFGASARPFPPTQHPIN